jgi:streptomycin 6-kinase
MGALLLQRVVPGTSLDALQNESTSIATAATLIQSLWRSPPDSESFPTLIEWFGVFDRFRLKATGNPLLDALLKRADPMLPILFECSDRTVLLHGDLHHGNILFSKTKGWVSIDPKGVIGDPAYDVGSFMLNMIPRDTDDEVIGEMLAKRLSIFAEKLRMDRLRIARWCFCHSVLSALWTVEEAEDPSHTVRIARILLDLFSPTV